MSKYNKVEIILLYQQDMPLENIAKALGVPKRAVAYHIYSSVKKGAISKRPNTKKGQRHNRSKLSERCVLDIYKLARKGYSVAEILRITPAISDESTIRCILKGKTWKELYIKYHNTHPKSP